MKKPSTVTVTVTLLSVLMLSGVWLAQLAVADPAAPGLRRFVGTAFIVFLIPDQPPLPAIGQVHNDGTFVTIDGTDEGLGGAFNLNSAALGVWRKTGQRQITARTMNLSYVEGIPEVAVVNNIVANYDEDLLSGTGALQQRVYDLLVGENPTDPEQGMDVGDPIPFVFTNLPLP